MNLPVHLTTIYVQLVESFYCLHSRSNNQKKNESSKRLLGYSWQAEGSPGCRTPETKSVARVQSLFMGFYLRMPLRTSPLTRPETTPPRGHHHCSARLALVLYSDLVSPSTRVPTPCWIHHKSRSINPTGCQSNRK